MYGLFFSIFYIIWCLWCSNDENDNLVHYEKVSVEHRFPWITLGQGSVESWFLVITIKQIYIKSFYLQLFSWDSFFFGPNLISIAGCISSIISMSISLQERFDLLGCTNRGWWLHNSATIRGFCYESSARWLLWDTAVQDFCVYWWTHICGRGELLLNCIIILLDVTAELTALGGF